MRITNHTTTGRIARAMVIICTIAGAAHAGAAGGSTAKLPRCLQSMTTRSRLAPYVDYLRAKPNVLRAFNPCQYQSSVLGWFVTKLDEAAATGMMPSGPVPNALAGLNPNATHVAVTSAEAAEIMGAKLARILFVEVTRKVPWSIASYADADLLTLFNVCEAFAAGCTLKSYGTAMDYVVDHSPRIAWDLLRSEIDTSALVDPAATMIELVKHTRDFRHGSIDLDPYLGAVTLDVMAAEHVARSGCQSMSAYVVALAAALNIPGATTRGYYAGTDHRTALFHATDQVLAHGDDVYFGNVPSSYLLDRYARWANDVLAYAPYQGSSSPAGHNSQVHHYEVLRLFPSAWTMSAYCGLNPSESTSGRAYLDGEFSTFATADQLTALEQTILARTAACSMIPADDPEGQLATASCTTCATSALVAAPACASDTQCDDGDPCTADRCTDGACAYREPRGVGGASCVLDRLAEISCDDDTRVARMIDARTAGIRRVLESAAGRRVGEALRKLAALRRRIDEAGRRGAMAAACGATLEQRIEATIASLDGSGGAPAR